MNSDKFPDEQGVYWAEDRHGEWMIAFVDTRRERVTLFGEDFDPKYRENYGFDEFPKKLIKAWYGPFACPGGDFGSQTVVASEEDHQRAKRNKLAIVIVHVDYRHCSDERHCSSITITATVPREQANEYVKREAKAFTAEK